ncbi:methyltransferase domain-containing protein [Rhodoligotrophos defluvii]|uniref:methyltransferase domain-containing protein n=1 Tax=Rhodoligotrophos defluvii TaxID=2561934 RepID=UPI0010C9B0B4|nr:methyltransferase domain-containing protein [Rhodoligotrophos defluvii]
MRPKPNHDAGESNASRKKLAAFAESKGLHYQAIDLGGGLVTPGHDRSYLTDIIFSEPVVGQRILDIGSFYGYFCIEALRRGASEAVGLDTNAERVRRATELADCVGLSPEYLQEDFETWDSQGRQFDIVLCLNVLHHMYDAVHALRKIMKIARRRIILEVAAPSSATRGRKWLNPLSLLASHLPLIQLAPPKDRGRMSGRTFFFTPAAMKLLFNAHTSLFEPITVTKSPFKGRFIVEARKRQIKNLVVVAGPTSCGKSTFAERLLADDQLQTSVGVAKGDWLHIKGRDIENLAPGAMENVLLELDLFSAVRNELRPFTHQPRFELIKVAEQLNVLTLVPGRPGLQQRISPEEITRLRAKSGAPMTDALQSLYSGHGGGDPIREVYSAWFDFVAKAEAPHRQHRLVINNLENYAVAPLDQFDQAFDRLNSAANGKGG